MKKETTKAYNDNDSDREARIAFLKNMQARGEKLSVQEQAELRGDSPRTAFLKDKQARGEKLSVRQQAELQNLNADTEVFGEKIQNLLDQ